MKCYCCHGKGWYVEIVDDMFGNSKSWNERCEYCDGIGWLDEEEVKKMNENVKKFVEEFFAKEKKEIDK